jgi:hypothetical protein
LPGEIQDKNFLDLWTNEEIALKGEMGLKYYGFAILKEII